MKMRLSFLKTGKQKKKKLVRANKWILHGSYAKLVKEEEDENVSNICGIKRKNPLG